MGAAENKEIVRNMFAELSKGNPEGFLGKMADDVRFTIIGTTKFSGTCNGKQELISKVLGPLSAQLEGGLTITPRTSSRTAITLRCKRWANPTPNRAGPITIRIARSFASLTARCRKSPSISILS